MAITRSFTVVDTQGKSELTKHTYVDDAAAGGEIVLTAKRVGQGAPAPTEAGFIETLKSESIIVSITNNGAAITWLTKPDIRGIHNSKIIDPGYNDGSDLISESIKGSFLSILATDKEDMVEIEPAYTPWGLTLRAEAPAQNLDLTIWVLDRR